MVGDFSSRCGIGQRHYRARVFYCGLAEKASSAIGRGDFGAKFGIGNCTKKPAATVIASEDQSLAQRIQTSLSNQYLRCYTTQDVRGVQCGGIFKNVFAIAAGCIDGLALGDNAKSAIITRGLIELQRISMHFEATAETIMGLSGLGDLIATCSSSQSRNWQFGHMVVTEHDASKWYDTNRGQTEGVRTIEKIMPIIVEYSLDLPIMTAVWRLIKQEASSNNYSRINGARFKIRSQRVNLKRFIVLKLFADFIGVVISLVAAYVIKFKVAQLSVLVLDFQIGKVYDHAQIEPYIQSIWLIYFILVLSMMVYRGYSSTIGVLPSVDE